ncbi:MAG: hypothetical protein WBP54_02115 [Pelodictyon phaeoclathratiforme]
MQIYYPPYHNKYNNIERYWAGLEKSWNGYLLESVATVINRSCKFTWRGIAARSMLVETVYQKVTFAVLAKSDDMDKVTALVEQLFGLLEKANRI